MPYCSIFTEESPREVHVDDSRPLPPIPTAEKVEVPDVPIVVFMGKSYRANYV